MKTKVYVFNILKMYTTEKLIKREKKKNVVLTLIDLPHSLGSVFHGQQKIKCLFDRVSDSRVA